MPGRGDESRPHRTTGGDRGPRPALSQEVPTPPEREAESHEDGRDQVGGADLTGGETGVGCEDGIEAQKHELDRREEDERQEGFAIASALRFSSVWT